jgi:hypothetical protein
MDEILYIKIGILANISKEVKYDKENLIIINTGVAS